MAGSVVRHSDGTVQFGINAPAATQVTVLTSTDFVNWQLLQSVPVTNGSAVFTDSTSVQIPARFYRLRVP